MGLNNVQWRFQEPVEFKHINDQMETNREGWKNAALLGIAGHDYMLDREAANLIEGQEKQAKIDAENGEQLKKETALLENEIRSLNKRNKEIQIKIENLQNEKERYLLSLESSADVDSETKLAMNGYDKSIDTGRMNSDVPALGSSDAVNYQTNMMLGGM